MKMNARNALTPLTPWAYASLLGRPRVTTDDVARGFRRADGLIKLFNFTVKDACICSDLSTAQHHQATSKILFTKEYAMTFQQTQALVNYARIIQLRDGKPLSAACKEADISVQAYRKFVGQAAALTVVAPAVEQMPAVRRGPKGKAELAMEARLLVDGGMTINAACEAVGIAFMTYRRYNGNGTSAHTRFTGVTKELEAAAALDKVKTGLSLERACREAGINRGTLNNYYGAEVAQALLKRRVLPVTVVDLATELAGVSESQEEADALATYLFAALQPAVPVRTGLSATVEKSLRGFKAREGAVA